MFDTNLELQEMSTTITKEDIAKFIEKYSDIDLTMYGYDETIIPILEQNCASMIEVLFDITKYCSPKRIMTYCNIDLSVGKECCVNRYSNNNIRTHSSEYVYNRELPEALSNLKLDDLWNVELDRDGLPDYYLSKKGKNNKEDVLVEFGQLSFIIGQVLTYVLNNTPLYGHIKFEFDFNSITIIFNSPYEYPIKAEYIGKSHAANVHAIYVDMFEDTIDVTELASKINNAIKDGLLRK